MCLLTAARLLVATGGTGLQEQADAEHLEAGDDDAERACNHRRVGDGIAIVDDRHDRIHNASRAGRTINAALGFRTRSLD